MCEFTCGDERQTMSDGGVPQVCQVMMRTGVDPKDDCAFPCLQLGRHV